MVSTHPLISKSFRIRRSVVVGSYGFVVPDSCADVSFYGSYGFVVPDSCAGVSFTVLWLRRAR